MNVCQWLECELTCTCRNVFWRFCGSVSPVGLAMLWFCSWVLSQEWRETTSSWYCWYLSSRPDKRLPNSVDCEHTKRQCLHERQNWNTEPSYSTVENVDVTASLTLVCRAVYLWLASCSFSVTVSSVLFRAESEPPTCSRAPWTESRTFWPEMETKRRSALWQITSSASWKYGYFYKSAGKKYKQMCRTNV